jgi:hypothetical protein
MASSYLDAMQSKRIGDGRALSQIKNASSEAINVRDSQPGETAR